jgi:HAD superfamily hydrolase (TIGR01509 family)
MTRSARSSPGDAPALQAVTADVWYTLIYPPSGLREEIEQARRSVWAEGFVEGGCSADRAASWAVRIERAADLAERAGWSPPWNERVREWSHRAGVPLDPDDLVERFRNTVPLRRVRVAPGAPSALDRLRRKGLRLAIISNVTHEPPAAIHEMLDRAGLSRRFDVVILSSELGVAKPRGEPFQQALAQLGTIPARTLHVGDSTVDVQGALAAGIHPLLFTGLHRCKPRTRRALNGRPLLRTVPRVDRWVRVPSIVAAYGLARTRSGRIGLPRGRSPTRR